MLTHLRVAEKVLSQINVSDKSLYFAGNIAPDSNMPPDITHWCVNGDKATCDAQGFYKKYISDSHYAEDKDFYYGYYVHLLTDIFWQEQKIAPLKRENKDIWAIKQKWRNVDLRFLADHSDFNPLTEMKYSIEHTSKYIKRWLDYYADDQVIKLINGFLENLNITETEIQNKDIDTDTEIAQFIDECAEFISLKL